MEVDHVFRALADGTRRRLVEALAERPGQTLFELHVRLVSMPDGGLSRQGLSRHLAVLEDAGLVRHEWRWRSKHHYLERVLLQRLSDNWLDPLLRRAALTEDETR
jgi:DNA-binding transcriptional ArsR family regulator